MAGKRSVVIAVGMNTTPAEKALEKLKDKIKSAEESLAEKTDEQSNIKEKLDAARQEADATRKAISEMKAELATAQAALDPKTAEGVDLPLDSFLAYQAAAESIPKQLYEATKQLASQDREAESLAKKYESVTHEVDKAKVNLEGMKAEAGGIQLQIDSENSFEARFKAFGADVAALLKNSAQRGIDALAGGLRRIPGLFKNAFSKGLQMVVSFGKGVLSTVKKLNVFSQAAKNIGPALKRLGTMIKQAFVFNVVTRSLNYVRDRIGELINKNTAFASSLSQLKGVLLTAFQPIYDHIIPALTAFINGLTRAMAVVAQFIAALFGKTAKQAQASAKALNDEAESLEGTGEAAEKAAGSLAGFDEINIIQTETTKIGGTHSADEAHADFGYMFDEDQIPFDSWGAAFDAFLGRILDGIPRLEAALGSFANKLNKHTQKVLVAFTFPDVKKKVATLGKEIASALNELVGKINWPQLGQSLGAGLGLALMFLVSLIDTFDWLSLGRSLAESLNGLVSQIDWVAFGQLLWSGFKIGLETLASFLLGLDMPQLAHAASDIVIGFLNSVQETVDSINWGAIGAQITALLVNIDWAGVAESASQLVSTFFHACMEFIENVDWYKLGQKTKDFLVNIDWGTIVIDLFTVIGEAFGAAAAFLWGLIKDAWGEVVDWWHETAFEDGKFTFGGLLEGIVEKAKDIGRWIKENIFQPFIDGFKKVFDIHSPSGVMAEQGRFLMDGLLSGIREKLRPILDFFNGKFFSGLKQALNGVLTFISGVFTGDWDRAWQGVKDIFKGVWNGIIGFLESAVNLIVSGINWLIKQMNKISFEVPDWVPGVGGKSIGINIPKLGSVSIPRLAQGAVIPPNREFMAVLGDQKRGTNVEAPLETIKLALVEALRESGSRGGRPIVVKVMLDKRVLATAMVDEVNDMTRSAGKSILLI